jgi:hypothetical protein
MCIVQHVVKCLHSLIVRSPDKVIIQSAKLRHIDLHFCSIAQSKGVVFCDTVFTFVVVTLQNCTGIFAVAITASSILQRYNTINQRLSSFYCGCCSYRT